MNERMTRGVLQLSLIRSTQRRTATALPFRCLPYSLFPSLLFLPPCLPVLSVFNHRTQRKRPSRTSISSIPSPSQPLLSLARRNEETTATVFYSAPAFRSLPMRRGVSVVSSTVGGTVRCGVYAETVASQRLHLMLPQLESLHAVLCRSGPREQPQVATAAKTKGDEKFRRMHEARNGPASGGWELLCCA